MFFGAWAMPKRGSTGCRSKKFTFTKWVRWIPSPISWAPASLSIFSASARSTRLRLTTLAAALSRPNTACFRFPALPPPPRCSKGRPIYARGPAVRANDAHRAAALATALSAIVAGTNSAAMSIHLIGYGRRRSRFLKDQPNVLRVLVGERTTANAKPRWSASSKPISTIRARRYSVMRSSGCSTRVRSMLLFRRCRWKKNRPRRAASRDRAAGRPGAPRRDHIRGNIDFGPAHPCGRAPRGGTPHRRSRDALRQGAHQGLGQHGSAATPGIRGLLPNDRHYARTGTPLPQDPRRRRRQDTKLISKPTGR